MLLCSPADSLPILPLFFPCRRLEQRELDWLQALPGRHFLSMEVLVQLLGVASENELRGRFALAFPLGWEEPNGLMAVPLRRRDKGHGRCWYIPTLSTKEQNGAAVGTPVESKRLRRTSLSSLSSSSSSSPPPPPPPNSWKYTFDDMFHVIKIFEGHEDLLATELKRDEDNKKSEGFKAFLETLDNQEAGHDHRDVNVGAICAATSAEWDADRPGRVLQTAREFIALGYLSGGSWPGARLSEFGYIGPVGTTSTRTSTSSTSTTGKRAGGHMDGSGLMSPPTSRSRGNAGEEASPSHLAMRHVPALLRPESITSGSSDFRAVVLLEVLLRDSRGRTEGETVQAYTNYAKRLVKGCFEGTGLKLPFNMNGSLNCYINLDQITSFLDLIHSGSADAVEVSSKCSSALLARRASSISAASEHFPLPPVAPSTPLYIALKAQHSAMSAVGGESGAVSAAAGGAAAAAAAAAGEDFDDPPADLGGANEKFSDRRMGILRHVHIVSGVSMEKLALVVFLLGFFWLGIVPSAAEVPSRRTMDAAFQRNARLHEAKDAKRVHEQLKAHPKTRASVGFDATVAHGSAHDAVNNAVLSIPMGPLRIVERFCLKISAVTNKSARGMASLTMDAIENFASASPGLLPLLIAALVASVVDHAAIAEANELFAMTLAVNFCVIGGRFHKTALVASWAAKALGLNRGADIINVCQVAYDTGYYPRSSPLAFSIKAEDWGPYFDIKRGRTVTKPNNPKSVKKQRWETLACMVKYMLDAIELRKCSFMLFSFLPHFFYVRMAEEHRKGDWQLKLFGRVNALMLDPRGLVQMETVAALHTFYQKKVNMMDRVPTSTKPSGHNLPLGLQSTWEEFGPMWEKLALNWKAQSEMSVVLARVRDIERYEMWFVSCNNRWILLNVCDCIVVESAFQAKEECTIHGFKFKVTKMVDKGDGVLIGDIEDTNDGDTEYGLRRQQYRVLKPDATSEYFTKEELVSIAEKQIQACMTTGKVKFMELHACYLEAPIVIASFFVPSKCVAFAKYSMSVVKGKKPLLFTGGKGLSGCDLSSSTDGNFFYLASRRQGHDHVAAEARLVAMIDEFGLLEGEFHSDWVELTKKSPAILSAPLEEFQRMFSEKHKRFCERLEETVLSIPHTEYILETLWAIYREHGESCDSMSDVSDAVSYCFNTVVHLNKKTLHLTKTEAEVEAARAQGQSVRLRATDTNEKREIHVKLLVEELGSLDGLVAPSREHYRQQKKGLGSEQCGRVLAAGESKRKDVTEDQEEVLVGGIAALYENELSLLLQESVGTDLEGDICFYHLSAIMTPAHYCRADIYFYHIRCSARDARPVVEGQSQSRG